MPAADRVSTEVLPTHALTLPMWDEIWTLTSEFYDVEREYAEMELRQRGHIALFRMNGALLGMASIDTYPTTFRGRDIVVISTTHVLIRENWRGRNLVQRLGFRSFLSARRRYPLRAADREYGRMPRRSPRSRAGTRRRDNAAASRASSSAADRRRRHVWRRRPLDCLRGMDPARGCARRGRRPVVRRAGPLRDRRPRRVTRREAGDTTFALRLLRSRHAR